jgi:hypothetical protein
MDRNPTGADGSAVACSVRVGYRLPGARIALGFRVEGQDQLTRHALTVALKMVRNLALVDRGARAF